MPWTPTPQIPSLPPFNVYIAFNPTNIMSTTQTWTDVTQFVRDGSTHGGRQHYLDRIESSLLNLTLDNRTGYFFNGTVNGTGSTIRTRLPIKVTASWTAGGTTTTYPVFLGVIDSVEPRNSDALNSDLTLSATDKIKYLSLQYLYNPDLYESLDTTSSLRSLYKKPARNAMVDTVGTFNGSIRGSYALVEGVLLYDDNPAIDLTNSTDDVNTADILLPNFSVGINTYDYALDFWLIGTNLSESSLLPLTLYAPYALALDISLSIDTQGFVTTANGLKSDVSISDGYWHHVGIVITYAGVLSLVVDGIADSTAAIYSGTSFLAPQNDGNFYLANNIIGYIDEIAISNSNVTLNDIKNRYVAGSLLRRDQLVGDRVAEVLAICGIATISSGTITCGALYIDGSPTPFTYGSSKNGTFYAQGQLDSVINSTGLDVILAASDTEIGIFFQADDGTYQFRTRAYTFTNSRSTTSQGTWGDNNSTSTHYGVNISIVYDDVDTWTNVIVSPTNGTSQTYRSGNDALYGASTLTKSGTLNTTNNAALTTAQFLGYLFKSPLPRVNSVELLSITNNGSNVPQMLGADLQDRITIQRQPINGVALNTDMVIESLNHEWTCDPGVWRTIFTLDPYPIRNTTQDSKPIFILDNSTYGKLDGTNFLL